MTGPTLPDFVWYTPNLTDDMHTGQPVDTEASELAGGEAFLSSFIPSVQGTTWYAQGGQIVIEWDEALDSDTSGLNGGSGGKVPTIVVSAVLKAAPVQDSTPVDTVGVLHTIEDVYGLAHLSGSSADGTIDSLLNRASVIMPPTTTTTSPSPTTTTAGTPSPTTAPPTTAPPTTAPPTTAPPTTAPPTTAPSTTPEPTSTNVTDVPEVGTSAQGLTATVSPAPAGGTVQFTVDGWTVGSAVPLSSDGTAVIAVYLADGPHLVQVGYSGSSVFDSSAVAKVVDVGQAPTSLLAAPPDRFGPDQLYRLSATLSSAGAPVSGAAVWFSGAGSALCIATTDASGLASCSIDEGSTDVFLLGTAGDTAAFGGDSTHLPAMGKSATDERDISGGTGSNGARASANGGQALSKATQSPASPASAAASDTPATLEVVHPVSRSGTGGLFVLLGLLGLGLVVLAALGRRRFVRAGLRHGRSTQSSA